MNSPEGKGILALVRGGAFAHAGEMEAIDLALGSIPKDKKRVVLDAGCGLGGTADYVREHGWGKVTGFDIDPVSIESAQRNFPQCTFATSDVAEVGKLWSREFDLVYCFNTVYAFPDQARALGELAKVAKPGATLVIFEYTDPQSRYAASGFATRTDAAFWQPLHPGNFRNAASAAGWTLVEFGNISAEYLRWYEDLVRRIESRRDEVAARYGGKKYAFVHAFYVALRDAIKGGILGGGLFKLQRT